MLDLAAIFAAYSFAGFVRLGRFDLTAGNLPPYFYASLVIFPVIFYIADLYYPLKRFSKTNTFIEVVFCVALGSLLLAAAAYFDRSFTTARWIFAIMALALAVLVYLLRLFYDVLFRARLWTRKTLILGTGSLAKELAETINGTPYSGMEVTGFVYESRKPSWGRMHKVPVVGGVSEILSLIDWYGIHLVVLCMDSKTSVSEAKLMSELLQRQTLVASGFYLFEKLTGEIPYERMGDEYLLGLMEQVKRNPYLRLKRMTDVVASLILLIFLFPVLLFAVFAIACSNTGKIFFVQKRIGRNGKPFRLLKLRSMAQPRQGKPRVTGLGRWFRRYRIDEIPQLFNVLRGDMSLVGPRPEIPYFVDRCRKGIPFYDTVFALKPGLTGWAQVRYHHTTSMKDYQRKFRYNLYYLKNISFKLDLIILMQTVRVIVLGKGK